MINPDPSKMEEQNTGPFMVTQIHVNGTVTLRKQPNVTQRINICRIKPYRS
jgi:hypothetical protein